MAKYELIKQIDYKNKITYLTKKDGAYVSSSFSSDENEAIELFEIIKVRGNLDPIIEVVSSFDDNDLVTIERYDLPF